MGKEEFIEISSNIKKKIIKKGKYGRKPSLGWTCCVDISFENKNEQKNCENSSVRITIGDGISKKDVLIERCIETMHLEEESSFILTTPKENTDFQVHITLKSFESKPYIFQWTDEEKITASNKYKAKGAELYKENKIEEAFYKFSLALKLLCLLDSVLEKDDVVSDVNDLRIALYNNLAGCHLHFKNYLPVIKFCSNSINLNPTSKALYRRSVAYIELKEYEKAENDLLQLLKLEPQNKAAREKYKLVRDLDKSNRENYQSIIKKMFT